MKTEYDEESLIQLTLDLLRTDNWKQDIYFRPTFYKADLGIGVRLHDIRDEFSIFVMAYEKYVKNDMDAHVTFSSWRRVDDNVIPARAKVAGAYVNSSLIKSDAVQSGFDEALVLDQNGHVSEGSAMNIFMVRDGVLVTPPVTDNILEGITRKTVIELAGLMGWEIANDNGSSQATLKIGNVGEIIIRNARPASAEAPAGQARAQASAPPAAQAAAGRPPVTGVINHISWGIEPWDTDGLRAELEKRGLKPRPDMQGTDFKSWHVLDPDGWDLQISNQTK